MQRTWSVLVAVAGLLGLVACKGGDGGDVSGSEPILLEEATGEGIVVGVSGVAKPDAELGPEEGGVLFDVQHVDRLVNNQVVLELTPQGSGDVAGKTSGNERIPLAPGTYDAHLVYRHSKVTRYEGDVRSVVVHAGRTSKYKIKVEAPVGFLDLRFFNDAVGINDKVTYTLFPLQGAGEERTRGEPLLVDEPCSEPVAVPSGAYDVHAVYHETETLARDAWIEGIEVPGAMEKLVHDYDYAVTLHGFVLEARNFGEDVNAQTKVYFYRPGAPVEFAVAQDQGNAGERLVIKPGRYDVRAVYQPTPEQSTWGDKLIKDVAIAVEDEEGTPGGGAAEKAAEAGDGTAEKAAEAGGEDEDPGSELIEMEVDFEKALATLKVQVFYGGEDVSEKAQLRVLHAGADRVAAAAVLNVSDLSEHIVPAGEYDIQISYRQRDLAGERWFEGVELEHDQVWEQTFDFR